MTMTKVFNSVGAKRRNHIWSWGAVRDDGTVFLQVWQDQTRRHDGAVFVRLTRFEKYTKCELNNGRKERLRHIELIEGGASCFMVMCEAKDPNARPREIKSINAEEFFTAGRLIELDAECWLEVGRRIPVRQLIPQESNAQQTKSKSR